jgi:hypothetical protein
VAGFVCHLVSEQYGGRTVIEFTRWQRIERAFHAVADEAPGSAREARVLALCGEDADLALEVLALLQADAVHRATSPSTPPKPRR